MRGGAHDMDARQEALRQGSEGACVEAGENSGLEAATSDVSEAPELPCLVGATTDPVELAQGDPFGTGMFGDRIGTIRHFSFLNSLLQAFNGAPISSPTGIISAYFLENFDRFQDLNIYDVAEECFTSRSGIRRFAQSIGFENFRDMKENIWEWAQRRRYFTDYADHPNYRAYLAERISSMIDEINEVVTDDELDFLAGRIFEAARVVLIASDFSAMAVREFQQSMLVMKKLVRLISDSDGDLEVLRQLTTTDEVIVVSASGNYARAADDAVSELPAHTTLITQNRDAEIAASYDMAVYLARGTYHRSRTVFAEYGTRYFFDLLYNRYFVLFGSEE